jgi:hypothetical protein
MKYSIALLCIAFLSFTACKNKAETKEETTEKQGQKADEAHDGNHTFACPMHPEVVGKEGEKCPKCGMALEHNDSAGKGNGNTYKMEFISVPTPIEAGKVTNLSLTPKIVGKDKEQVPLDVEHEKKIHFIMVSSDLSWFDHQHPDYKSTGSYDLPYTFKNGGEFILFADYKPTGSNHTLEKININVKGKSLPSKTYTQSQLTSKVAGFEVTLSSAEGSKFESGALQHLKGVITKGGKAVNPNTLENYLGAKAHMVIIGVEDKNYLHVHPGVENGNFDLHTTFEKPGIYRGWLQFQSDGKVHTTDFVFKVEKGSGKAKADDMEGMKH